MRTPVLVVIVIAGLVVVGIAGVNCLWDWALLKGSMVKFGVVVSGGGEMRELMIAEARMDWHRINCFAEGVGVLLGAILTVLGAHGLCLLPVGRRPTEEGSP